MTTNTPLPPIKGRKSFRIKLNQDDCVRLYRAGLDRNLVPEEIAERIVRTVLRDQLVTAVLDDGGTG